MTLREKQMQFARLVARLLDQAHALGYGVTLGDAYRDPRVHGGMGVRKSYSHPKSGHKLRLAIDLNLFRGAEYLDSSDDHKALGEWWEKQHPLARWGGHFSSPDGNHYSLEHEGVK